MSKTFIQKIDVKIYRKNNTNAPLYCSEIDDKEQPDALVFLELNTQRVTLHALCESNPMVASLETKPGFFKFRISNKICWLGF